MNEAMLQAAVDQAGTHDRVLSLLVVRRGRLALEAYFNRNSADSLNDVRSVTKSIVSTLTGIALKQGHISSLDQTVGDYLYPKYEWIPSEARAITIRHLLTMSAGFEWDEQTSNSYNLWITAPDQLYYALTRPLVNTPGSVFTYNSGAVHVLAVMLQEAVGMPLPDFAQQNLFTPIGIERNQWEIVSGGLANGGAGVDLRPRDLARLGQLYLMGGKNGDHQILPIAWVTDATSPRYPWRSVYGPLKSFTYGYLWWVEEGQSAPAYLAWGYGGQFIYVVPSLELVVVTTTIWRGVSLDGGPIPLEQFVLDIIINKVVPAAG